MANEDELPWHITQEELMAVLEKEYGLRVAKLDLLNGYDDLNYYVQEADSGREFLLKVYCENYSRSTKEMNGENDLLTFLGNRKFPVPQLIPSKSGSLFYLHVNGDESRRQRICRLQVFFPGQVLLRCPITPAVCTKIGCLVGGMDAEMAKIENPFVCVAANKAGVEWDLGHLHKLRPLLEYIADGERRSLALRAIDFAESKIMSNFNSLPTQTIHGDINEQNIIINADGSEIVGVIDFGDAMVTKRVFEPAVAMMYFSLFGVDVKQCAMAFLHGYLQSVQLSHLEKSLLFPCVIGRYAQSLVIGSYTAHKLAMQNKPNDYVLTTSKRGWPILAQLMDSPLGAELADLFENKC